MPTFALLSDPYALSAMGLDFVVLFAILVLVRKAFAVGAHVDSTHEMAEKDNHAFAVSLAGATVGLGIMTTGVASGDVAAVLWYEAVSVAVYGIAGVAMMMITRRVFDIWAFPDLDIRAAIAKGNIPAAILDAGNMIATAVILRGIFSWSAGEWTHAIPVVIVGFVLSQFLLTLSARARVALFASRNRGRRVADAVLSGNPAVAVSFAGFNVGAALAVSAAGGVVTYHLAWGEAVWSLAGWTIAAVVLLAITYALGLLLEKVVLHGVPVDREVAEQGNLGVAMVEAAAYVAVGMVVKGIIG